MTKLLDLLSNRKKTVVTIAGLLTAAFLILSPLGLISSPLSGALDAQGRVSCQQGEPGCTCESAGLGGATQVCSRPAEANESCDGRTPAALKRCLEKNPIIHDIQLVVNFLTAGVGLIVIAVIIWGGIQYAIAGDNPQHLTEARRKIVNGVIALVAFIFTFAFLQWLIPGSIFG